MNKKNKYLKEETKQSVKDCFIDKNVKRGKFRTGCLIEGRKFFLELYDKKTGKYSYFIYLMPLLEDIGLTQLRSKVSMSLFHNNMVYEDNKIKIIKYEA